MVIVPTTGSEVNSAVEAFGSALSRIADYRLEPSLQNRLLDLGERKEFLSQAAYYEFMALVDLTNIGTFVQ